MKKRISDKLQDFRLANRENERNPKLRAIRKAMEGAHIACADASDRQFQELLEGKTPPRRLKPPRRSRALR
jgi:hypothetical protein